MNVILALVTFLKADSGVFALCGSNVFDHELPPASDVSMPQKAVVVRRQGGPDQFKQLYLNHARVSVVCYGETPNLAEQVYAAVYQALKVNLTPSVWASTYIQFANEATPALPFRDPVLQWPYNVSSWMVTASDMTIT